jgi:hypothetical protein
MHYSGRQASVLAKKKKKKIADVYLQTPMGRMPLSNMSKQVPLTSPSSSHLPFGSFLVPPPPWTTNLPTFSANKQNLPFETTKVAMVMPGSGHRLQFN